MRAEILDTEDIAAWAAALAALRDVKLPRAWWDADSSMVLCSDEASDSKRLTLRGIPIVSSYCVFEADPAINWRAVIIPTADEQNDPKRKKDKQHAKQRWILADQTDSKRTYVRKG
jgi:exosome complex component RRP43